MDGSLATSRTELGSARRNPVGIYIGLSVACAAAVGWALYDRQSRNSELSQIRETLAQLEGRRELDAKARAPQIYVTREAPSQRASGAQAVQPASSAETADEAPAQAARDEERVEPTPEERAAASRARYQHIQGIFESQTAADYDPVRVGQLETRVKPALESLRETSQDLKLGQLECRGRMCGVDVAFKSDANAGLLFNTLTRATMELGDSMPLIHLVMLPTAEDGQHSGRAYFEWRPAQ